jgi:hypothetical protein
VSGATRRVTVCSVAATIVRVLRAITALPRAPELVPLELGGNPNSAKNLWVEPPTPGHTASQGVSNRKTASRRTSRPRCATT